MSTVPTLIAVRRDNSLSRLNMNFETQVGCNFLLVSLVSALYLAIK